MPWDPDQYLRFQQERFAPFDDLLALIEKRPNLSVVDLGCGSGELTARLAEALPGSTVLGIDSSPEMLARARTHERPGLRFELGRLEEVTGEWDVVFSNAALQWVEDHRALIPRLLGLLRPGGRLSVQVPANWGHPAHLLLRQVADEEPFQAVLAGWSRPSSVLGPAEYAELLYAHGGRDLTVYLKIYPHVLPDAAAMLDWARGTALVPYLDRLPPGLQEPFLDAYRTRLEARWPERPVFYGFARILFAASRV